MMKHKRCIACLLAAMPLTACSPDGFRGFTETEYSEEIAEESGVSEEASEPTAEELYSMVDDLFAKREERLERENSASEHGEPELQYLITEDGAELLGYDPEPDPASEETIMLPDELEEQPVTAVGKYGFSGADYAHRLVLPNTVTRFGEYAFKGSSVTSLTLRADGITMADYAFKDCVKLGALTLMGGSVSMGEYCFDNSGIVNLVSSGTALTLDSYCFTDMPKLEMVTLSGDTVIGEYGFQNCPVLSSVTLTDGSFTIMDYAFDDSALENLVIGECAGGTIGEYCFMDCFRLENVLIEEGITEIGSYSFSGCRRLESVILPASVTKIGGGCFADCSGLVLMAPEGSYAQQYAEEHGLMFVPA